MWDSSLSSLPWHVSRVWGMREMKVRWLHMRRMTKTRQNVATQAMMHDGPNTQGEKWQTHEQKRGGKELSAIRRL